MTTFDKILDKLFYKVLSFDLQSLGYNRCQLVQYRLKRWNYPLEDPTRGMGPGGLWVTKRLSKARELQRYGWRVHKDRSVLHLCIIDRILYKHEGSGRVKTNRLYLLDRVNSGIDTWPSKKTAAKTPAFDIRQIKTTIKATMSDLFDDAIPNFLNEIRGMITGEYDQSLDDVPFDVPEKRSLIAWIAGTGGIRDKSLPGEIKGLITGEHGKRAKAIPPGFLNNERGRGLDEVVAEANSDGWQIEDESHLLVLLEQEQREAYSL